MKIKHVLLETMRGPDRSSPGNVRVRATGEAVLVRGIFVSDAEARQAAKRLGLYSYVVLPTVDYGDYNPERVAELVIHVLQRARQLVKVGLCQNAGTITDHHHGIRYISLPRALIEASDGCRQAKELSVEVVKHVVARRGYGSISEFNDARGTTTETAVALLDDAIKQARGLAGGLIWDE